MQLTIFGENAQATSLELVSLLIARHFPADDWRA
jgi:hypothetical protein